MKFQLRSSLNKISCRCVYTYTYQLYFRKNRNNNTLKINPREQPVSVKDSTTYTYISGRDLPGELGSVKIYSDIVSGRRIWQVFGLYCGYKCSLQCLFVFKCFKVADNLSKCTYTEGVTYFIILTYAQLLFVLLTFVRTNCVV